MPLAAGGGGGGAEGGGGVLLSGPPLPRAVAGLLPSLVAAGAAGAAPPEVAEGGGKEGGDGRWLWEGDDEPPAECPTRLRVGGAEEQGEGPDMGGCGRWPSLAGPGPSGAGPR